MKNLTKSFVLILIAVLALLVAACKSTKVPNIPELAWPDFPELFITVHHEEFEVLQQTTVPDSWLTKVTNFYNAYKALQKDYEEQKPKNKDLPDITFPVPPELSVTVHKEEVEALKQTAVPDDWLYKLADFCDQYQALRKQYAQIRKDAGL